RVCNYQERHLHPGFLYRRLSARGRHARRLSFHLLKVRRPGCVAETRYGVLFRKLKQFFKRAGGGIHACVRIADLREALWHREEREVGWVTVTDLVPRERC